MAAKITNKHDQFSYAQTCLQAFLLECGRTEGILQSDNEEYLIALLKATAKACGNMTVRFSPAYSSQSNGNVERYHRTLTGQIRTLREQVQQNYNLQIPTDHPLMAWSVRRSAYLINRFLIRADGYTSYQARWGRTHNAALFEFGETVMYMVPTLKQRPKLVPRFFRGTWLGKCTSTGESFVGVAGRVVRARTVRRLAGEAGYDKQMLGTVKGTPWNPSPPLGFQPSFPLPPLPSTTGKYRTRTASRDSKTNMVKQLRRRTEQLFTAARSTQQRDDTTPAPTGETQAKKARTEETKRHTTEGEPTPTAHTTMRLGTSLTPVNRPPTTSKSLDDHIHEGSASKSRKETTQQQAATRPEEAGEQAKKPRMRINAVTVQLKSGKKITTATSEDAQEVRAEQRLLEPHIYNNEGFDTEKLRKVMRKEMESMRAQKVYEVTDVTKLTPQQRQELNLDNIIDSRWVYRSKGDEVRARIVAKGYTEHIEDQDDVYASTPLFAVLRILLALSMARGWIVQVGDISTAFLHALAASAGLVLRPPKEYYTNPNILWRLHKAMYGLRSYVWLT